MMHWMSTTITIKAKRDNISKEKQPEDKKKKTLSPGGKWEVRSGNTTFSQGQCHNSIIFNLKRI